MDRLVLGLGALGQPFLDRLDERSESLSVLVGDERDADRLRDDGIDARNADLTDAAAVRTVAGTAESVVVAVGEATKSAAVARTARRAYPEAFLMACLAPGATESERSEVAGHADRVLEPAEASSAYLLERAGESGLRARKLQNVLRDIEGTLAVVTHGTPDPDAIASAVGLCRVADSVGTDAEACYHDDISHQENRALVNLLDYDLRQLDADTDLDAFDGFALVDHSRPGINDGLPAETPVDIVVDHHPPRAPVEGRFVDLRSGVGATSTLVTDYLQRLGADISPDLATGLMYGIQTDTRDFSREVSLPDFEAAAVLVEAADTATLQRIESPSVTADTFEVVAAAIANRRVEAGVLTSYVGETSERDAIAQAADKLLEMEDVSTTLVFGDVGETVYVSGRTRGTEQDLGEALREAFGRIGSAGGHAEMAGAQIPVGILLEETDDSDRGEVVEEIVTERFFDALGIEPDHAAAMVYSDFFTADETGE